MSDILQIKSSIKDYEVHFSDDIAASLSSVVKTGDFLLIDEQVVNRPQLKPFITGRKEVIMIQASENAKSYEGVIPVIDTLIKGGFKRNNTLIAVGGGVTQDITAFRTERKPRGHVSPKSEVCRRASAPHLECRESTALNHTINRNV